MWFFSSLATLLLFNQTPSGKYLGSKSLFGETIQANVNFKDTSNLDISISGDFVLNCADESYSVTNNQIVLDDIDIVGDCAHDALVDNNIVIQSIAYDSSRNDITLTVVYSVLHLDIVLKHENAHVDPIYIY
jgi:hypothetical protein